MRVERKVGVAGDGEAVHGEGVERLACFQLVRHRTCRPKLREAVGHEEDEDDEQAVCWALDLKVAEQRVRAEEIQCLIDNIRRVPVGYDYECLSRERRVGDV